MRATDLVVDRAAHLGVEKARRAFAAIRRRETDDATRARGPRQERGLHQALHVNRGIVLPAPKLADRGEQPGASASARISGHRSKLHV